MKSSMLSTVLALAMAGSSAGSPVVRQSTVVPSLTVCTGLNWTGNCKTYTSPQITWNTCYQLGADFPSGTAGGVSSTNAFPDGPQYPFNTNCILYPNPNCTPGNPNNGGSLWVGSYGDLSDPEVAFNKKAQSFQCRTAEQSTWDGWSPGSSR